MWAHGSKLGLKVYEEKRFKVCNFQMVSLNQKKKKNPLVTLFFFCPTWIISNKTIPIIILSLHKCLLPLQPPQKKSIYISICLYLYIYLYLYLSTYLSIWTERWSKYKLSNKISKSVLFWREYKAVLNLKIKSNAKELTLTMAP